MATQADFVEKFGVITAGLDNIAEDIQRLKAQIAGLGLSAEVEDQLLASVSAIADRVSGIAGETPEPEPEV